MQRIHLFSVRAEVRETLQPMTARGHRGDSEGTARGQQCALLCSVVPSLEDNLRLHVNYGHHVSCLLEKEAPDKKSAR